MMSGVHGQRNEAGDAQNVVQGQDFHGDIIFQSPRTLPVPRQLRPGPGHFADREEERRRLETIRSERSDGHPTTLVLRGTHGVGKTALALTWLGEIHPEYDDGHLHVELGGPGPAGGTDPRSVLDTLLRDLGAEPDAIGTTSAEKAAMFRSLTAGRSFVLLLDDAGSAAQVRALLPNSADALVVVTTTARLGALRAEGAQMVDVSPMGTGAIAGMLETLLDARDEDDRDAIRALARRCHGLPLVARIAAVRLLNHPAETVGDLVAEMDEAGIVPALEEDGDDVSYETHIGVFYDRLTPRAAFLYRVLGLHPVPRVDVWAAAAGVDTDARAARRLLRELEAAGMLEEESRERFRMPAVVHQHAEATASAVFSPADRAEVAERFADYYLAASVAADTVATSRWRVSWRYDHPPTREVPEFATKDAAWTWLGANLDAIVRVARREAGAGNHETVWQLVEATDGFFRDRGHYDERFTLAALGTSAARQCGNRRAQARMHNQHGFALLDVGDPAAARDEFAAALGIDEADGDLWGCAAALECLGIAAHRAGDDLEAMACYDRAEPLKRDMARPRAVALLHLHRSRSAVALGEPQRAVSWIDEALPVFRAPEEDGGWDRANEAKCLLERGRALGMVHRPDDAVAELDRAVAAFAELGQCYQQARAHEAAAEVEAMRSARVGEDRLWRALELYRAIHNTVAEERVRALLDGESGEDAAPRKE